MVDWDSGETLAARFRAHAGNAQHLYGYAMRAMADDWEAGGPVRTVCAGYEDAPPGAAIQLRLLAGVFRLVLTGRAEPLRRFYPCLGGTDPPSDVWPTLRQVISDNVTELHGALEVPPQTNEVGRSVALLAGLFDVVRATGKSRIRLLEIGASAGLNLLVDRFRFETAGWHVGPADSPLVLGDAIEGPVVPWPFMITDRRGCDLHPVDVTAADGRLLLTSFVWPFDIDRHQRLAAALRIAADHPVRVDAAAAGEWLAEQLEVDHDGLTVVWQSITQLYWPAAEVQTVDSLISSHGRRARLARVTMEFPPDAGAGVMPDLRATVWSGRSDARVRTIGTAHYHGLPVRLRNL